MLSRPAITSLVSDQLFPQWSTERDRLDVIDRWYRWQQGPLPLPRTATPELKQLADLSKTPWLGLVVTTVAQTLYVDGYRSSADTSPVGEEGAPGEAPTTKLRGPWRTWQANGFDQRQLAVHRAALAYGYSFVTVLPGNLVDGNPTSVLRGVSPRKMFAVYEDPAEDDWPAYAMRVDTQSDGSHSVRVYDDEGVYRLTVESGGTGVTFVDYQVHGAGVCPVVRYTNQLDLDGRADGEVEPFIPLAQRINKTSYDRLLVQHFSSWKVRYAAGMAAPDTEEEQNAKAMQLRVQDILISEEPDTKFGTLDATDPQGFIQAWRSDIEALAAATQTPTHELTGQMANLPLALDTIVPLPGGRTTMANMSVGDQVIDPSGRAVTVTALSPVYTDRECYRLRFDDGNEIVADADHKWSTTHFVNPQIPYGRRRGAQRETSMVTTTEIAASLKTSMGTNNHFIPVAAPHDGPAVDLPIDPYVLGVWLGDGDHHHGSITSHRDDCDELAGHLRECGEIVTVRPYPASDTAHRDTRIVTITKDHSRCPFGHQRPLGIGNSCRECGRIRDSHRYNGERLTWPERANVSFAARLDALGVRLNKHIPEGYFHGSVKQRLALIQGIMDTDGTVNREQGSAVITLHHERLATDLHRMIQSVGHKAALRHRAWTSKQLASTGECWRMSWSAVDPVFRLARKRDLQRTDFAAGDGKSSSPYRRYIVACERVESVPMRCLTVDSDSHLFCVTDAHIATHNSAEALAAARASLSMKVAERQKTFGRKHVQALQLAAAQEGHADYAADVDARVTWQDMEIRSLSQAVDALGKAAQLLGVPARALWGRIPGVEKSDVDEWARMAAQDDPVAALSDQLARQDQSVSADAELEAGAATRQAGRLGL